MDEERPWQRSDGSDKWCRHGMRGTCHYDRCKFKHPTDADYKEWALQAMEADRASWKKQNRLCNHYVKDKCEWGSRCRFWHPADEDPFWDRHYDALRVKEERGSKKHDDESSGREKKRGPKPPPQRWWTSSASSTGKRERTEETDDEPIDRIHKLAKHMSSADIKKAQNELDAELARRDV